MNRISWGPMGCISNPYCKYKGQFGRIQVATASYLDNYKSHYLVKLANGEVKSTFTEPEKIYLVKPLFKKKINIYG